VIARGEVTVWVRLDVTTATDTTARFIWLPKIDVWNMGVAMARGLLIAFPIGEPLPPSPLARVLETADTPYRVGDGPVDLFVPTGAGAKRCARSGEECLLCACRLFAAAEAGAAAARKALGDAAPGGVRGL